jgi:hypothetical protein
MPLERRGKTGKAGQHVGSRKKGRATKCRSSMPASKAGIEPPRVCRSDRAKNVGTHPGKHGGRHYAVSAARTPGGVTDGCQHATARCIVTAANAGVLRCTSQSAADCPCVAGEKYPLNLIWIMPAQGSVRILPRWGLSLSRASSPNPPASSLCFFFGLP